MKNFKKGFIWLVILMVIIIILAVGGISYYVGKSSNISSTKIEDSLPLENQLLDKNNTNSWITDSKIGLTYNPNWTITPETYRTPGQEANNEASQIVGYRFTLPSGNTIMWGGHQSSCSNSEFSKFQYGVSTITCINGVRSNLGLDDVKLTPPKEDVSSFGDFVLKNQKENIIPNGALRKEGETCGEGVGICEAGLECFYPCGIPGCQNICAPMDSLPRP